ncbi:inovirus Gp2 family protein [Shewanella baltica]|uniref:inovirus Gp2 family protein n=1 Tax=Shewanella baltica TaxID=62322 RepID=UPI002167FCF1|nr:inovirus Gp2 family protein [Shewanella baltica]MCS6115877.1 inovirus Gp2 family protein [Shewanella baltica]UVW63839.1 inovirus Gp2 family protein [Shewanella baltica]
MDSIFNRNLTVLTTPRYDGLQTLSFKNGAIEEYLNKIIKVINGVVMEYSKVFAIRVDLRFPDTFESSDTAVITRFFESLKAQLKADYQAKLRNTTDGQVHASELFYIWVKEMSGRDKCHYHVCLFFNGHAYKSLGKFELGRANMYNRIHKAWASALRLDISHAQGLIHFPENAQYLLCRNQADFTYIYQDLFKRLSYFAKTDTKIYGNGNHNFGCSRISGRLQSW